MIRRDKNVCFKLTLLTIHDDEVTHKEKDRRYDSLLETRSIGHSCILQIKCLTQ
jgi:hypothetical protein